MQFNFKLTLFVLTMTGLFFTSCKKDEETFEEQLQDTWVTTSFTINQQEMIGVSVEKMTMAFGEYNGTEGSVTTTTTDMNGDVEVNNTTYFISDDGGVISIWDNGETIDFTTTMEGNNMTMSGVNVDGLNYVIRLTK